MKQCVHCKEFKPLDEFAFHNRILKTRQKHCRACMSKFNKASYEKTDKRRKYDNKIKRREAARQYVWDYLSTHPCVECGDSDPRSLEFDHIRGPKKESVSVLANGDYALDRVKIEISKCQVLCANCHRKKTYDDRGWFRG